MAIQIETESPGSADARRLLAELHGALLDHYPAEFVFRVLGPDDPGDEETTVLVARRDEVAVGCGALHRRADGTAEVMRLYTHPDARGLGIAGTIVDAIEYLAMAEGHRQLLAESGDRTPAAWRVFERAGFERTDDQPTDWSVVHVKELAPPTA